MKKLFTLIIALFAMVSASMADEITQVRLAYRVNNGTTITRAFYASGVSTLVLNDENITSLVLQKVEVYTSGSVSDVNLCGAVYNSGSAPSTDQWANIPASELSNGYWKFDNGGEGIEMIESGWAGKTKIFEFYAKAKNGSGSDIYYNNGGQNYQIKFSIGSGTSSDWTVKYYSESTARLNLQVNGEDKTYVYNGEGVREQYYGENPGEVSSFGIEGFYTKFIYNEEAGVNIANVTLQYRINVDGTEGQWNSLYARNTGWDDIWNEAEQRYDHRLEYTYNGHVNVLNGLTSGHNYVLEYMYQVLTTAGDYIFMRQGANDMKLAFTVKEGSAVQGVSEAVVNKNAPKYSVAGALVGDGYKGIVIQGGKKIVVE